MRGPARAFGLVVVVAAIAAALIAAISARGREPASAASAGSWRGLVGGPRALVSNGQRSIVVLRTPSLGQRLAQVRYATEAQERAWTAQAAAAQQEVLTTLAIHGILLRPDFTYQRVLDGFSAALDPRAIALLEQMQEVVGVYPVRPAFPASRLGTAPDREGLRAGERAPARRGPARLRRPGRHGRAARHRRRPGASLPARPGAARATTSSAAGSTRARTPTRRIRPRSSGTAPRWRGSSSAPTGPDGLHGVAPGATVLPIRVAGWQPAADGSELVYARSDQLLAGLERAVDPNGDGDAHDAVRVASTGVVEPYAAFTDGPEALGGPGRARAEHAGRRAGGQRRRGGPVVRLGRRPGGRRSDAGGRRDGLVAHASRSCGSSCAAASMSSSTGGCRSSARSRRGIR